MATRLNDGIRRIILNRLMAHAFDEETKKLKELQYNLGDLVYCDVYTPAIRKKMEDMPKGFMPETSSFNVVFGGQVSEVSFAKMRRVAGSHTGYTPVKSYEASSPRAEEHLALDKRARSLTERRKRAKDLAWAALENSYTVERLVKNWPEAAPFVQDYLNRPESVALTVPVKELNKELGLP